MTEVYLGLGSNIGEREENLQEAVRLLGREERVVIKKVSSIYETAPVGYLEQDNFLNMTVSIMTCMEPFELLAYIQDIEIKMKRDRSIRWGPRTIDIDILLYGSCTINEERIIIPHKEMFNRAFVLIPLREIYEQDTIGGKRFDTLICQTDDKDTVKIYKND